MEKAEGVNSGFLNLSANPDFYRRGSQKSKTDKSGLKSGEILHGTVLEVISKDLIKVRLPIGTFTALIQGRFIVGDTLFFKVVSNSPALILKIHSVSKKINNKNLSPSDCSRILDIDFTNLSHAVIEFISNKTNNIERNLVLQVINSLEKFDKLTLSNKSPYDILNTIYHLCIGAIPDTKENFLKFFNLFKSTDLITNELNNYNSELMNLYKSKKDLLINTFLKYNNRQTLNSILNPLKSQNESNLIELIDSQALWNHIAYYKSLDYYFLVSFQNKDTNYVCAISLLYSKEEIKTKKLDNIDYENHKIALALDKCINEDILTKIYNSDNLLIDLKQFAIELYKKLLTHNLIMHEFLFNINKKDTNLLPADIQANPKNFSVVI